MNHSRLARQRGVVALMAVLFLLFMLGVVLVIAHQMAATDVHDSSTQNLSVEALFLAESGLETGGYRYRSGTACNSPGFDLTQPLGTGTGSFTLTAATYKPAATTLTAGLAAASGIVPVASIAGFAPHGRISIANEEINYAGLSSGAANCAPAAAPCFTGAVRGAVGSPTPALHPAGTAVNQNQCLIRSVGATNIAQRTLEAATTVKNVQSGSIAMNPATRNVALTAVDMGRTFVLCHNRTEDGDDPDQRVTCDLTSATNLQIRSEDPDNDNIVQWHVVEFTSGIAVQRGLATIPRNQPGGAPFNLNVALTPVDPTRSFVLISERFDEGNAGRDEIWTIRARLSSPTNLELSRNREGGADDVLVAWQVIQMQDATVQSGTTAITNNNTFVSVPITAVDTSKTFVVFTRRAENGINGREGRYQVRGELTNATTLTFTRAGNSDDVDIAWFAVTLNDGTTVQRGTTTLANNNNTANVALAPAIVPNRSFPIFSVSGGTNNNNNYLDDTSITADLTSTTNLRLERDSNSDSGTATVAWFVVNLGSPRIDWQEIIP
jgi:hypothetical protein